MTRPRFFAAAAWALLATSFLATPVQAAPAFKNISAIAAAQNGNADPTVTLPAHAANDVLLLSTIVRSGTATVATPTGWTQIGTPTVRAGTATYQFFWIRAAGTNSETNPVINRTGTTGDVYAAVVNYSGATTTGDPWEVKGAVATGTADPATCTAITTLSADALVVAALAGEDNNNGSITTTGTDPAAYTEHYLESGTGADGLITFSEAVRTTAGATGNVSVNFNSGNPVGWGCMVLALTPQPTPTLSSAADQTFNQGDPPLLASSLTVTEHATTPTITAANDLRIRIPATFNATWDTSITTVTLGGAAAGKAGATLSAYEDANRTAVINVTSDFVAGDALVINGLRFTNFTAASAADNLELAIAGAGAATVDEDDKTITIVDVNVSSAGSRILNDNAARTPVAAEDADVVNWDKSVPFLVTIGIQTNGGGPDCRNGHGNNKLQWRNVTDAPGVWNTLGTTAGPEMVLFSSANLVHANNLAAAEAQIGGNGTYIDGEEAETNTGITWSNRTRNGDHTAIQFPIDPSGGTAGKTYQFRFIVDTLCGVTAGTHVVSVNVTLVDPVVTPGSFNAFETGTAANAITGVITTRIAGTAFSLDVVAISAGAQLATFTNQVTVELLGNNTLGVALDANNCPTSFTTVQTVTPDPTITAGRSTVNFAAVSNSWRDVRVRVRYPTTSPTVTSCSTDNFAVRPSAFTGFAVTDTDWETAGTGRALTDVTFGTVLHKAGRPLSVRADAVNAAGSPATTTNYTGAPTATISACTGAACTATFGSLTLGTTFTAGQLASDVASYDNVGSFRLELVDSTFASVDASDSSALEREVRSGTINVGRFVPDHFAVALNTPVIAPACGSFSYVGQPFNYTTAPAITVTAQNFANGTTTLYAGSWWRLTNSTVTPATQAARYSAASGTLDLSLLPATGTDPAIDGTTPGSGAGTLTFSAGTGLAFTRSTTTPDAPFNADISLAVNIIDADGVVLASNPASFSSIDFTGNNKSMRFGRLRLENAVGSEKLSLPIPMRTEYWTGTAFQTNSADSCTSISAANVGLGSYFGGINATNMNGGNVSIGGAFASGVGSLTLTAPAPVPSSAGAVTVTVDLSAEAKSYLKGNWGVSTFTADPSSRAAFGLYGSQPGNFIYFRENY